MSGRQFRKLLLFAAAGAFAWWIYKERPTLPGIVDTLTRPIFGTKAAVKGDERNRIVEESAESITTQQDANIGTIKEGMTKSEIRDLLGRPDRTEYFKEDERPLERWIYERLRRNLVFGPENRLLSISVR